MPTDNSFSLENVAFVRREKSFIRVNYSGKKYNLFLS